MFVQIEYRKLVTYNIMKFWKKKKKKKAKLYRRYFTEASLIQNPITAKRTSRPSKKILTIRNTSLFRAYKSKHEVYLYLRTKVLHRLRNSWFIPII